MHPTILSVHKFGRVRQTATPLPETRDALDAQDRKKNFGHRTRNGSAQYHRSHLISNGLTLKECFLFFHVFDHRHICASPP